MATLLKIAVPHVFIMLMPFLVLLLAAASIIFLLGTIASAFVGFGLRNKPYQKKWQSYIKYAMFIGIPSLLICVIYIDLYPNDDFYFKEFSKVTLRAPPNSAKIIAKSATRFGLHSCETSSYSRIELSPEDYLILLNNVGMDKRFMSGINRSEKYVDGKLAIHKDNKLIETQDLQNVHRAVKNIPNHMVFIRVVPDNVCENYSLIFLSDGKHIEIGAIP